MTESMARILAVGGDCTKIRFTFQEYFRRMTEDPKRWSQPFAALLGAFEAQMRYGLPSIGGKDSMSGTFNDIDVPPTLVSFAVDTGKIADVVTPELKRQAINWCGFIYREIIRAAGLRRGAAALRKSSRGYAGEAHRGSLCPGPLGMAAAVSKMAFGNGLGVKIEHSVDAGICSAPIRAIWSAKCRLKRWDV